MRAPAIALLAALIVAPVTGAEAAAARTWVEVSVFCRCCEPPWGRSETDIRPFFHRHKIPVYGYRKEGRIVCAACSCPSNLKQMIRVRTEDVSRVRALLARSMSAR